MIEITLRFFLSSILGYNNITQCTKVRNSQIQWAVQLRGNEVQGHFCMFYTHKSNRRAGFYNASIFADISQNQNCA